VILTPVTILPQQVILQPSTEPQIAADAAITDVTAINIFMTPTYTHCTGRLPHLPRNGQVHHNDKEDTT